MSEKQENQEARGSSTCLNNNTLRARELLYAYHNQVLSGCGSQDCFNPDCASSGKLSSMEANEAAALALKLLKCKAPLCSAEPFRQQGGQIMTERRIKKMNMEGVESLVSWLKEGLGNPELFSQSFPGAWNESGEEWNVDLDEAARGWALLFAKDTPPAVPQALIDGLNQICINADIQFRFSKDPAGNQWYFRIAQILLELPVLCELEFQPTFQNILRILNHLPLEKRAALARLWSKKPTEWLMERVHAIQQLMTIHILQSDYEGQRKIQDDNKLISAVKALELFFAAALLGGERDSEVELKKEADFYSITEAENNHRLEGRFDGEGGDLAELLASGGSSGSQDGADAVQDCAAYLEVRPLDVHTPLVPYAEFYNETLCDSLETDRDFVNYKAQKDDRFSYLNFPFVLMPHVKMEALFYENRITMYTRRRREIFSFMLGSASAAEPYLKLHVSRTHPVRDALGQLNLIMNESPEDLKKQLRVEFDGEQGIDEGGPSKEFYQLVTEELFNPDYGMFVYNEDTRLFWFNPHCLENEQEFILIGILFGLAIYNNIIVDVHFPLALYRKILGKVGRYPDLEQLDPVLYRGLESLLTCPAEEVEETYCYTFRISYTDVYGTELREELKVGGSEIPVTAENRREFVELYADFLLNTSVRTQFSAFRRGFLMVVKESSLDRLFRPDEIEQLICGIAHLDFNTLEQNTNYDGGFSATHPTIIIFWEVAREMSDADKKLLLQFTTGSDRVPVGGLSKLKFVIAKNGDDSDRLPTAHTCFNALLLPEYSSKEKLQERLTKAISNSRGFGLR